MTFSHDDTIEAEDAEGGGFADIGDGNTKGVCGEEEETEDEEVKVNCINGAQASDLSSDDESEEESDVDDPEEDGDEANAKHGLVQFVSSQAHASGFNIHCPRAVLGLRVAQKQSLQDIEERDDNENDASSMDESSDDENDNGDSSTDSGRAIGMSLEATRLDESDDEEESDVSSHYNEGVSSAGGVAGSDSESDDSEEEEEEEEGDDGAQIQDEQDEETSDDESEPDEEMMSDGDSAASVPLECFEHCDNPSDVVELEAALQESKHDAEEDDSVASDDSDVDLQDSTLQSALLCDIVELETKPSIPNGLTHAKRVLSSSALLGPASSSSTNPTMLSPKRVCRDDARTDSDDGELRAFMSIGQSAYQANQRVSLSDEDDKEQDRQLSEELEAAEAERERESTPVPLLTPPGSPLRIDSGDEEGDITVCEWPCNLTVDSAMAATMDLRPPSPQNLQTWEQQEEERLMKADTLISPKATSDEGTFSSTLTPMMRGISMELEAPSLRL